MATRSPLGPILARIIIVEPENTIVHQLKSYLCFWNRYVGDTLTIVNLIQDGRVKKAPIPTSFFSVASTNVIISLQNFMIFSLNLFAIPVLNFKAVARASLRLLNLNQEYPSKKLVFVVKASKI